MKKLILLAILAMFALNINATEKTNFKKKVQIEKMTFELTQKSLRAIYKPMIRMCEGIRSSGFIITYFASTAQGSLSGHDNWQIQVMDYSKPLFERASLYTEEDARALCESLDGEWTSIADVQAGIDN